MAAMKKNTAVPRMWDQMFTVSLWTSRALFRERRYENVARLVVVSRCYFFDGVIEIIPMRCKDEFVVSLPWHGVEHVSRSSSTRNQVELTEIIPSNQCVVVLMSLFLFHIETNVSRCRCRSIPICMVLSLQDPRFLSSVLACVWCHAARLNGGLYQPQ